MDAGFVGAGLCAGPLCALAGSLGPERRLVDPDCESVAVCRSPSEMVALTVGDDLAREEVVPGFSGRVAELLKLGCKPGVPWGILPPPRRI